MGDKRSTAGIGLTGAMFLLFLGLRLTDHIDWEWYWVAAPLWVPVALVFAIAVIVGAVAIPVWIMERRDDRKRRAAMSRVQLEQEARVRAAWRKVGL